MGSLKVQVGDGGTGGLGLASTLFVVFLVLKLCNVIDWSWWYVTMPLWIGLAILAAIFAFIGIGYFLTRLAHYLRNK